MKRENTEKASSKPFFLDYFYLELSTTLLTLGVLFILLNIFYAPKLIFIFLAVISFLAAVPFYILHYRNFISSQKILEQEAKQHPIWHAWSQSIISIIVVALLFALILTNIPSSFTDKLEIAFGKKVYIISGIIMGILLIAIIVTIIHSFKGQYRQKSKKFAK